MAQNSNLEFSFLKVVSEWQECQNPNKNALEMDWHEISQRMIEKSHQMTPFDCYGLWMRLAYRIDIHEDENIKKDEVKRDIRREMI